MKQTPWLILGLAAALAGGAQASQEQLASSIGEARQETVRTAEQLKATLDAVNTLARQTTGNLRPTYDSYCAEVAKTEAAATWTRSRVNWMAGDGAQYFKGWQATIDSIANASLRKQSQKRLNTVRASYDRVEKSLQEAGRKFRPFLSDLSDIQKALAADVTTAGIRAARGTIRSATANHAEVNAAIQATLREMDKMQKSLSPQAQ